jgi:drug/metabolite transporter (DMT)-like permease
MAAPTGLQGTRGAPAPGERARGVVALLGVQVCFGLFPLFVHWAADPGQGFAPRAIVFWRILVGGLVLGALAALRHPRKLLPERRHLGRLAVCALLGVPLNMGLALEGMARTSVIQAGLMVAQIPVFTYAVAWLAGQERLRLRRALGIALACVGAALLVLVRGGGAPPLGASRVGPLLMVVNCFSYAVYLVAVRRLLAERPALVVLAWVFGASLLTLPWFAHGVALIPPEASARAWTGVGYSVLFPTVLAYLWNGYALARVAASTAAVFIYLQPVISTAAAVAFAGERFLAAQGLAALLSFAGVWLVLRSPR